jgi:ABC-2 type transport system permease protein
MLFSYGLRVNPNLIKDIIASPVVLKVGQVGDRPQLERFPWLYSPLVKPNQNNPIGKNLDMVNLDFVSPIDTLKNNIKKTILLSSSSKTRMVGVPVEINFNEIGQKPQLDMFQSGTKIFAVLLEGKFKSCYKHRIKPFEIKNPKEYGTSAIAVISDGDIIKNQVDKGNPLELGYDKWSKLKYDNKQFLLNTVDYLIDKSGVISLKNKEVKLKFLDKNKVIAELSKWQVINTIVPLIMIGIFGFAFYYYRKKKYSKNY